MRARPLRERGRLHPILPLTAAVLLVACVDNRVTGSGERGEIDFTYRTPSGTGGTFNEWLWPGGRLDLTVTEAGTQRSAAITEVRSNKPDTVEAWQTGAFGFSIRGVVHGSARVEVEAMSRDGHLIADEIIVRVREIARIGLEPPSCGEAAGAVLTDGEIVVPYRLWDRESNRLNGYGDVPVFVVPEGRLERREGLRDAEALHYRTGAETGPVIFAADPEGSVDLMTLPVVDDRAVDGVAMQGAPFGDAWAYLWFRATAGEALVCGASLPVELVVRTPEECAATSPDQEGIAPAEQGIRAVGGTVGKEVGWGIFQYAIHLERLGDGDCRFDVNVFDREGEPLFTDVLEWAWPEEEAD